MLSLGAPSHVAVRDDSVEALVLKQTTGTSKHSPSRSEQYFGSQIVAAVAIKTFISRVLEAV